VSDSIGSLPAFLNKEQCNTRTKNVKTNQIHRAALAPLHPRTSRRYINYFTYLLTNLSGKSKMAAAEPGLFAIAFSAVRSLKR